jgi:chromosome segregation ATPase
MAAIVDLPLAGPRALRAATGFLDRLPQVEEAIAGAVRQVQRTLDEVLARLSPIESEIESLREQAGRLERQLAATGGQFEETDRRIDELRATAAELTAVAARLEGTLEHLVDKVPGLSPVKAARRGRAVEEEVAGE